MAFLGQKKQPGAAVLGVALPPDIRFTPGMGLAGALGFGWFFVVLMQRLRQSQKGAART